MNASPFFGGGQHKITQDESPELFGKNKKIQMNAAPTIQPAAQKIQYNTKPPRAKRTRSENRTLDFEQLQQKHTGTTAVQNKSPGDEKARSHTSRKNHKSGNTDKGVVKIAEALKTLEKSMKEIGGGEHAFLKAEEYILNKLK